MVTGTILCCMLVLAVTKTFLLVDALFQPGGGAGVVANVTQNLRLASSPTRIIVSQSPQRTPGGGSIKVG